MKTIKIMIAASEEMHDEKLEFTNLIEHLNEVLGPRGIELKRIKWNPETDGSIEEYKAKLKECEMCLTLYWRDLAGNSGQELDTAYQELKDGNNPRNLYVFFKEPTEDLTEALKDFKANFVTKYGHFFCKFENVDTMNLHFILQFEAFQNHLRSTDNQIVKVADGKVTVADKEFVNLDNVPFAALNKEYQRLQKELLEIDIQVTEVRKRHKADPDNEDIEDELMTVKSKRKKLADEFEKYQIHLYDIALNFAKTAGEKYSERMRKARELFEIGDVNGADEILNMQEMLTESEKELKLYEQNRHNLEIRIEEFLLKADVVMANKMISSNDRFANANTAFIQALTISRSINIDKNKLADILFSYACFLDNGDCLDEALPLYREALDIYRNLKEEKLTPHILIDIWFTLHNLAILLTDLKKYTEAENMFYEALDIYNTYKMSYWKYGIDLSTPVADTWQCLANLHYVTNQIEKANTEYLKALDIYLQKKESDSDEFILDIADKLYSLAMTQIDMDEFEDAERNLFKALEIRKDFAERNPDVYNMDYAASLEGVAWLKYAQGDSEEAERRLCHALILYEDLEEKSPGTYINKINKIKEIFSIEE